MVGKIIGRREAYMSMSPSCVLDGDAFAIKVVAVAGYDGDWTAYVGPTDWTDEQVAEQGDKLTEAQAGALFYVMQLRRYRQ